MTPTLVLKQRRCQRSAGLEQRGQRHAGLAGVAAPSAEMSLAPPGLAGAERGAGRFRRLVFGGMAREMTSAAASGSGRPYVSEVRLSDPALAFVRERHLATLSTTQPEGGLHVVPVGSPGTKPAPRPGSSAQVVAARPRTSGLAAAPRLCQVDGRRWLSVEGPARIIDDPETVSEAERRYAARYRPPRVNPSRVCLIVAVGRVLGSL